MKQPDAGSISAMLQEMDKDKNYPEVIPELRDLLDNLRDEESKELERLILRDGIRDNVIIWKEKNAILDGHNRIRIAKKHGLDFPRHEISMPNLEAARSWIIENQLGRRNLTPDRFTYFLGLLYNTKKEAPENKGKTTEVAEDIAKSHGVSSRTVRRAGETASGIDMVERVKGKLDKIKQLSGKGDYTQPELKEIGKAPSENVAKRLVEKLDKAKSEEKKEKTTPTETSTKLYDVVLSAPAFDAVAYSAAAQKRPPLKKDGILYMHVEDAYMGEAFELLSKWNLTYECQFVMVGTNPEEGVYSRVMHETVLVATSGTVAGPEEGQEFASVLFLKNEKPVDQIIKIVGKYHPNGKKLDMRKGAKPANGWDGV